MCFSLVLRVPGLEGPQQLCCEREMCSDLGSAHCFSKYVYNVIPKDCVKSSYIPGRAISCSSEESMWAAWQSHVSFLNYFSYLLRAFASGFSSWCFHPASGLPQRQVSIQGTFVLLSACSHNGQAQHISVNKWFLVEGLNDMRKAIKVMYCSATENECVLKSVPSWDLYLVG